MSVKKLMKENGWHIFFSEIRNLFILLYDITHINENFEKITVLFKYYFMCFIVNLIRNDLAMCLLWDVILNSEQWNGGELSLIIETR